MLNPVRGESHTTLTQGTQGAALVIEVCERLEDKSFSVSPLKCEFGVKESDFLGHWLTPTRVKPSRKKIQGILNMKEPSDLGQLGSFLGMATNYCDMWPRCSHILSPLVELIATKKFLFFYGSGLTLNA